jgi:predicted lipoprotein with Yx(FWY)xxD motif
VGRIRRGIIALVALVAAAAIAAGCGGGNSGSGGSSGGGGGGGGGYGGGGAPSTSAGAATLKTANSKVGTILVDASGRTLYLFQKDTTNKSNCSGACVSAWPVLQSSGTPKGQSGVQASMLGTIKRGDGATQVTYNGHPLYYYSGDTQPGQLNGQGLNAFGALWYVVGPNGSKVT